MSSLPALAWINVIALAVFLLGNSIWRKVLSDSKGGKLFSNLKIVTMIVVIFVYFNEVKSQFVLFPVAALIVVFAPVVIWNIVQYYIGAFSSDDEEDDDNSQNDSANERVNSERNDETSDETSVQEEASVSEIPVTKDVDESSDQAEDLDEGFATKSDYRDLGKAFAETITGTADEDTLNKGAAAASKILKTDDEVDVDEDDADDDSNILGIALALGFSLIVTLVYAAPLYYSYSILKQVALPFLK